MKVPFFLDCFDNNIEASESMLAKKHLVGKLSLDPRVDLILVHGTTEALVLQNLEVDLG